MMAPKFQLLALLAFAVAMLFLENQIHQLEESRGKLGEEQQLFLLRALMIKTLSTSIKCIMMMFGGKSSRMHMCTCY